jgi:hypothetical protein
MLTGLLNKQRPGTMELVPWGVAAVQATSPAVVAAAKLAVNNVAFCIIDTGALQAPPASNAAQQQLRTRC